MTLRQQNTLLTAFAFFICNSFAFLPSSISATPHHGNSFSGKQFSSYLPARTSLSSQPMPTSENQIWDVDLYQKHSFVYGYGSTLVDDLDPTVGETILDIGCGSGQLTKEIAKAGSTAIGFDADPSMVERCQKDYPDLEFFCADAANFAIPKPVDAIFSNAALHWVTDAEAAVSCMSRALKSGGRFVVELGGRGNVNRIVRATNQVLGRPVDTNPWYFPSIAQYSELLERYGIEVLAVNLYDRPTVLEEGINGMSNWLRMFGGILLKDVPDESKEQVIKEIVSLLKNEEDSMFDGHVWTADYRRLRVMGRKLNDSARVEY